MQVCSHAGASAGLLLQEARLHEPVPVRLEWRPRRSTPPSSNRERGLQLGAAFAFSQPAQLPGLHRASFQASITQVSPARSSLLIGLLLVTMILSTVGTMVQRIFQYSKVFTCCPLTKITNIAHITPEERKGCVSVLSPPILYEIECSCSD